MRPGYRFQIGVLVVVGLAVVLALLATWLHACIMWGYRLSTPFGGDLFKVMMKKIIGYMRGLFNDFLIGNRKVVEDFL